RSALQMPTAPVWPCGRPERAERSVPRTRQTPIPATTSPAAPESLHLRSDARLKVPIPLYTPEQASIVFRELKCFLKNFLHIFRQPPGLPGIQCNTGYPHLGLSQQLPALSPQNLLAKRQPDP